MGRDTLPCPSAPSPHKLPHHALIEVVCPLCTSLPRGCLGTREGSRRCSWFHPRLASSSRNGCWGLASPSAASGRFHAGKNPSQAKIPLLCSRTHMPQSRSPQQLPISDYHCHYTLHWVHFFLGEVHACLLPSLWLFCCGWYYGFNWNRVLKKKCAISCHTDT